MRKFANFWDPHNFSNIKGFHWISDDLGYFWMICDTLKLSGHTGLVTSLKDVLTWSNDDNFDVDIKVEDPLIRFSENFGGKM